MALGRKKREETVRVSYRLNAELEQQMRDHCEKNSLVMGRFIEQAIREKLDRDSNK